MTSLGNHGRDESLEHQQDVSINPRETNMPWLTRATRCLCLALVIVAPFDIPAQETASYDVPGISAWSTSKTYGFLFHPERSTGESLSNPRDGMNTRLTRTITKLFISQTVPIAQVVGGQPSVMPNERNTTFTFFGGRTLQPGWTVKSVDLGGNFTYVQQPRLNTSDPSFRVRLAPGGSATLRKVVLNGPPGADWKEAFSAPVRKDYVINGTVAWNAARKYGFTFKPLRDGTIGFVTEPLDGVSTTYAAVPASREILDRCTEMPGYRALFEKAACIIGQVVGGNMSVTVPRTLDSRPRSVTFELFGAKKLSPGWIIKSVSVSNGTWVMQPQPGTSDLMMKLTLTSYGDTPAIGIVRSVTLEGPSNAASFEDAFRNAQNR